MKCKVQPKRDNTFDIQFKEMTKGEVFALINALRIARTASSVATDLSGYLRNGFHEMKGNPKIPTKGDFVSAVQAQMKNAQEFMDILNEPANVELVEKEE